MAPDPVLLPQSRRAAAPRGRSIRIVLEGKGLFYEFGCASCHRRTSSRGALAEVQALAGQLIWPYTDLLLHDMGEGLADDRPEGVAERAGVAHPAALGHRLTEDGQRAHASSCTTAARATSTEAILWHGGEAEAARDAFARLPKAERDAAARVPEVALRGSGTMRARFVPLLLVAAFALSLLRAPIAPSRTSTGSSPIGS